MIYGMLYRNECLLCAGKSLLCRHFFLQIRDRNDLPLDPAGSVPATVS